MSEDICTAIFGTNAPIIRFRGSSGRSDEDTTSPGVPPPNTEPDTVVGVAGPLGEPDLEPDGVDVEAKREETEAFETRYGREDIEEAMECESTEALILGSLNGRAPLGWS